MTASSKRPPDTVPTLAEMLRLWSYETRSFEYGYEWGLFSLSHACLDGFHADRVRKSVARELEARDACLAALRVAKARLEELAGASHCGGYGELATLAVIDAAIAKAEGRA